ncbi:MAG: hypothetical protein OEV42_20095 [Deltaproteobacteria bacterium]|nr:hypothetical protein [Deltaproteobacteria bacterium]
MKKIIFFTLAIILLTIPAEAYDSEKAFDFGKMAGKANLVLQGTVVNIDYRESQGEGRQKSLPHTFVTFEVEDVLYGKAPNGRFTLRFFGGSSDDGTIMMMGGAPHFDLGDEDIIFVKGNGASECPLIGCDKGRFRLFNNRVYNEYGQALIEDGKGNIIAGKRINHEAFTTFQIKGREYKIPSKKDEKPVDLTGTSNNSDPIEVNRFIDLLRQQIAASQPDDPHGIKRQAKNVDKNAPFSIVAPKQLRDHH